MKMLCTRHIPGMSYTYMPDHLAHQGSGVAITLGHDHYKGEWFVASHSATFAQRHLEGLLRQFKERSMEGRLRPVVLVD